MVNISISLFLLGVTFGSGYCLASCGPVILSYVAGTKNSIFKSLWAYMLFSSARVLSYIGVSFFVFFIGKFAAERFLGGFSRYLLAAGGCFIILTGLSVGFPGKGKFSFWRFLEKNILGDERRNIFILGLIIGFLPCAPLLAVLSYIGLVSKSWLDNLIYSSIFGMGTTVSFLLLFVLLAGVIPAWLSNQKYRDIFNFVCGLVIVLLGVQLVVKAFY